MSDDPAPRQETTQASVFAGLRARGVGLVAWFQSWRWTRQEWLLAALLAPLALVLGAYASEQQRLEGRVLPEVYLMDARISGLNRDQMLEHAVELRQRLAMRSVTASVGDQRFTLPAGDLGFSIDVERLVDLALGEGRDGNWLSRLMWRAARVAKPVHLDPPLSLDEERFGKLLDTWRESALVEPVEGDVIVVADKLSARWPRSGARIDRDATHDTLRLLFLGGADSAAVPTTTHRARLDRATVQQSFADAQRLTSKALILELPDELRPSAEPGEQGSESSMPSEARRPKASQLKFPPKLLLSALRTNLTATEPARLELSLALEVLQQHLNQVRAEVEVEPASARFNIDFREKISIEPGHDGTRIDESELVARLLQAAQNPDRRGELAMLTGVKPELITSDAESLGITQLVSRFTTHHPCCRPRVDNIHRIADLLNDTIVRPGETFSVNEALGQRTQQSGFVQAPTIVHGEMKDTVGGGISQFATTLFNAVLEGGYEIIERQPHSYYFPRYPVGHEATLSFPKPDLIFKNDTKSGLLIKTQYAGTFIRVSLYGNNEGRKVRRKISNRFDIVEPPVRYEANDELDPEEEKVLERGQIGWSVNVSRIITYPEGKPAEQSRKVVYNPRERVVAVHSCRIPEGEEGHTGVECPAPEIECEEDDEDCLRRQAEFKANMNEQKEARPGDSMDDTERDWDSIDE